MRKTHRSTEKRRRTIDAARFLILRDGLRGTSMEAIAREAGIAKPTLYTQFPDKNAVFVAVFEAFLEEIADAADGGFLVEGEVWDRIGEVLARQYLAILTGLNGSPHSHELMTEPRRSGSPFEPRHLAIDTKIKEEMISAGASDPDALTRLVTACAYGVSLKFADVDEMASAIRTMSRRLIEPEVTGRKR